MSGKATVAALVAGVGAWLVLRGTTANGSQAKVVYVSQPKPENKTQKLLGALQFALGIADAATGEPIFEGGQNASTFLPQGAVSGLSDRLSQIGDALKGYGGQMLATTTGTRLKADLMRDFGLAPHQAAGVVGNLDHETGGFKFMQEISPTVPGSRGGYGFAQWTGTRRNDFEAWARARGLNVSSYEANYGFLKHELTNTTEKRVLPKLRAARTVEEATQVFSSTFLRPGIPHMSSRVQRAQYYA